MGNLLRSKTFSVVEVLTSVDIVYDRKWSKLDKLGAFINTNALIMWREKGIGCIVCGITGAFFAKERTPGYGSIYNNWHLNLYAVDHDGEEILMTQDHVVARGNGGEDHVRNLQPMCYPHNQKKADKDMTVFLDKIKVKKKQKKQKQKPTDQDEKVLPRSE